MIVYRLSCVILAFVFAAMLPSQAEAMYDPGTGRFVQRDPAGYVDGMNRYAGYHVMHGGVDPMGMEVYAVDGTYADWGEGTNVERFVKEVDQDAYYWGRPDDGANGADSYGIITKVMSQIESDRNNSDDPDCFEINLVGWSRGGQIVLEVAHRLGAKGIEVNFLGLFDAVNMINPSPGYDQPYDGIKLKHGKVKPVYTGLFSTEKRVVMWDDVLNTWFAMDILPTQPSKNIKVFVHAKASNKNKMMITVPTEKGLLVHARDKEGKFISQDHGDIGSGDAAYQYVKTVAKNQGKLSFNNKGNQTVFRSPNATKQDDGDWVMWK